MAITSVTVSPASNIIKAGLYKQLIATVVRTAGEATTVTWSSDNANITVDANGWVYVANDYFGIATITATSTVDINKKGTAKVESMQASLKLVNLRSTMSFQLVPSNYVAQSLRYTNVLMFSSYRALPAAFIENELYAALYSARNFMSAALAEGEEISASMIIGVTLAAVFDEPEQIASGFLVRSFVAAVFSESEHFSADYEALQFVKPQFTEAEILAVEYIAKTIIAAHYEEAEQLYAQYTAVTSASPMFTESEWLFMRYFETLALDADFLQELQLTSEFLVKNPRT